MKKLLPFILLIALPLAGAFGQGIGVGLKGGLNFANQNFADLPDDISARTGFHVGAYVHVELPGGLGVQPEIQFSAQGSTVQDAARDVEHTFSYMNIPLLVRFNIAMFNIHLGPQFGILINAEQDFDGATEDIKDQLKSGDFSIAAGVGIDLPANLNLTARYVAGLSDVGDGLSLGQLSDFGEVKNTTFQVSLGYRLIGNK